MQPFTSEPTPVVPEATSQDNAWALPRPQATTRQMALAAVLAAACLSLASFAVGVSVGKTRGSGNSGGSGGSGRNGGFGAGAFAPVGSPAATGAGSATTATTTTTVDPNLGGLLPGLDASPDTTGAAAAVVPTTTSSLSSSSS